MAGGDDLKLLGAWPSPFVTRVKLALALKDLSYEDVEEDLYKKSELLLKSNPVHKKIPVLIHNGAPVCESMIILQYIDEVFAGSGPSLLPADPYECAIARFWMAYVDDKLVAPWRQWLRGKTEEEKSEGKKQAFAAVEILEGALRECSKGGGFFGGDGLGLVDVALGGVLSWMKVIEVLSGDKIFDAAKTPLLAAWVERFSELDAAKVALPDVGRLLEFAKAREAAAAPSN
ncbi:probable glutathione S-transferase GSTU6 [Triticum dicoccoides]|uniref:probable glutathione S-transferase GSTU6 n=1 Tax=Triticum dicoccoides TaxID=85692 RepID=UPI00189103FD|nr:probable glutathione S-transferase GSTU6 [Triticum dicoccoides]